MADKSFGVKELNLLNASGTPTVTSPNNLNLNANTVAISTSATVGNNLTVSGQINVGSNIKIGNAGVVTATSFVGSGANLTGISAGISTDPSNVQATWKLGGGSGSGFTFTGPGQDGSEGNPDIYLVRGQRYLFDNTALAGNHPFEFRNEANDADYTDGVSGAQNGLQYINVQHDAPAALKYRCTIHQNSMLGNIYIVGQHLANGANDRILTATSAYGMNAESNLQFDGTNLFMPNELRHLGDPDTKMGFDTDTIKFSADGSERLRISSTGNLMLRSETTNYLVLGTGGDSGFDAAISNNMNWIRGNQNHLQMNTATGGFMGFEIGGSEKFKIASSGQFGIGGSNYGTAGQVIKSTGASSAPVWASGGKAIQYSTDYKTAEQNTGSSSWQNITGLARTVTPKNADSRFLLLFMATGQTNGGRISIDIAYSATGISDDRIGNALGEFAMLSSEQTSGQNIPLHLHWVHHPNTANAVTYTPQFRGNGSNTVIVGASNHPAHFTVIELEG